MVYYHAKNLIWGALEADDTVTVSFDIYTDQDVKVDGRQEVHGSLTEIQQMIQNKVKSKCEAVGLYAEITQNTELAIEMTQQG